MISGIVGMVFGNCRFGALHHLKLVQFCFKDIKYCNVFPAKSVLMAISVLIMYNI